MPTLKADSGSYVITGMDAVLAVQKPLPENHPFYALIGRVVAEWARLEHILDQIIWDLAKGDKIANSGITGQIMGHYPRFKIILALAEHRGNDKKIIDKIKEISGAVAGLSDERNRYVHDAWFLQIVSEKVSAVGQFKSLSIKSKKVGFKPIKEQDVKKFLGRVGAQAQAASKLRSWLS